MRTVVLALVSLLLVACNEPSVTSDFPSASCEDVASSIERQPKVKRSHRLDIVEQLACHYGIEEAAEESTCSIPTDVPEFGGKNTEESYGLKDETFIEILHSIAYGNNIEQQVIMWRISHHGEIHDTDSCLNAMHDVPEYFDNLTSAARSLSRYGY
jgi:hypothetical protein